MGVNQLDEELNEWKENGRVGSKPSGGQEKLAALRQEWSEMRLENLHDLLRYYCEIDTT